MTQQLQRIELGEFAPAPVNRARLARYLELPSVAQIDPITDDQIRTLDDQRRTLLSPWASAVEAPIDRVAGRFIELAIDAPAIEATPRFGRQLLDAAADSLIVGAFSLGARVDEIIKAHLEREEVFEAFVLKQWAATMAEQLRAEVTRRLRLRAQRQDRSLMPYDGPGYNGWPLSSLKPLLDLIPGSQVRVTESGVLLPTNSMVIVHGVSPIAQVENRREEKLGQCYRCAMRDCRYRMAEVAEVAEVATA
jgi:hypothetical protein